MLIFWSIIVIPHWFFRDCPKRRGKRKSKQNKQICWKPALSVWKACHAISSRLFEERTLQPTQRPHLWGAHVHVINGREHDIHGREHDIHGKGADCTSDRNSLGVLWSSLWMSLSGDLTSLDGMHIQWANPSITSLAQHLHKHLPNLLADPQQFLVYYYNIICYYLLLSHNIISLINRGNRHKQRERKGGGGRGRGRRERERRTGLKLQTELQEGRKAVVCVSWLRLGFAVKSQRLPGSGQRKEKEEIFLIYTYNLPTPNASWKVGKIRAPNSVISRAHDEWWIRF